MVEGEEEREALTSSPPLERFGSPSSVQGRICSDARVEQGRLTKISSHLLNNIVEGQCMEGVVV
jgi:hypothetical protein